MSRSSNPPLVTVRVFRGTDRQSSHYDSFRLAVPSPSTTTILDLLLRIQQEFDPCLAFRHACRAEYCGSCALLVNGREALACKTTIAHLRKPSLITLAPLNNFPLVQDLAVDMSSFFEKFSENLVFFQPHDLSGGADSPGPYGERLYPGDFSSDCIGCGCCVSSCTQCQPGLGFAGPAVLLRAFELQNDPRDALHQARMDRMLDSSYGCRTQLNCAASCPKGIEATRAIHGLHLLALGGRARADAPSAAPLSTDRRRFIRGAAAGAGVLCATLGIGAILGGSILVPRQRPSRRWIRLATLDAIAEERMLTLQLDYEAENGFYTQRVSEPVYVFRSGSRLTCFSSRCSHAGCRVLWNELLQQFRCTCHAGAFSPAGEVLSGPPPAPLPQLDWKIDNGQLLVEVG
ncbi:MAG: 2Fe-2S iron-sulfur cluster-binding protein [Acidobacteriota bacterium]|nr:2Fe-2S iron-sulfur cluster-binding protein [Acidobacteriota bacterium]